MEEGTQMKLDEAVKQAIDQALHEAQQRLEYKTSASHCTKQSVTEEITFPFLRGTLTVGGTKNMVNCVCQTTIALRCILLSETVFYH